MYRQTPDPWPLWLAKQHQEELIHEADQYRLAKEADRYRLATAHPDEPADRLATRLFAAMGAGTGRLFAAIRAGIGRPFAAMRRALSASEAPCDDLRSDCAPC